MRSTSIFLAVAPLLGGSALAQPPQGAEYNRDRLYNETSGHSSFNVEVMRGMALVVDPVSAEPEALYAIHSYQSSLIYYDLTGSLATVNEASNSNRWKTITDPVAVAVAGNYVYVLGQGSHALAKHDRGTGDIVEVMMLTSNAPNSAALQFQRLGSEPADMVLNDAGTTAYISLMGADAVVEINLASMSEIRRWQTTNTSTYIWKRPRFLALDNGRSALYVAPFLSGNGTFTMRDRDLGNSRGDGFDTATLLETTKVLTSGSIAYGLPDEDLFKIDLASGKVTTVVSEAGSLLTAHGIHGDEYWMLGIDSRNADFVSEPAMRGNFARNILSRNDTANFLTIPVPTTGPVNGVELDLDDPSNTQSYSEAESIPFPYAMAFGGPAGTTAIASSTLSRVAVYDSSGGARALINLEDDPALDHYGKVIRDVTFTEQGDLYIYCQQTSNIIVWPVDSLGVPAAAPSHSFFLGFDNSALGIAAGRDIFYDATKSKDHRFTCATCHPGGESDVMNWELKDGLWDFKDPMLTQTLKGLRETFPYHWRGERSLSDFNGAFGGLLGNEAGMAMTANLTEEELQVFEDFIFTLRPAANPHALIERTMDKVYQPLGSEIEGFTGKGLMHYENNDALGGTCADCHPLPTGGMGLTTPDNISGNLTGVSTNGNVEMIQLSNFLQAREQRLVGLSENGSKFDRASLGSGFRHNSGEHSLFGFIQNQFQGSAFGDADAIIGHVSAFIQAMDTGTPPGSHAAVRWDSNAGPEELALIVDLIRQAKAGWIDVIAFGLGPATPTSSTAIDLSWIYDTTLGMWRPDDRVGAAPISNGFLTGFGLTDVTILGTPHGQGHRLGVDYDNDQILNKGEVGSLPPTDPWNPNSDGDPLNLPDGYQNTLNGGSDMDPPMFVDGPTLVPNFINGSTAMVKFATNEPVTWTLTATPYEYDPATMMTTLSTRFGVVRSKGTTLGTVHTAHIHGLGISFHDEAIAAGFSASDLSYELVLEVRDIADLPAPLEIIQDNGSSVEAVEALAVGLVGSLVVDEIAWDPGMPLGVPSMSSTFEGTANIKLRRYNDSTSLMDADGMIIFAQVQRKGGLSTDEWEAVPDSQLAHTAPNYVSMTTVNPLVAVKNFGGTTTTLTDYGSLVGSPTTTPILVLGETDSGGAAPAFTVFVSGSSMADSFRIQIVAVAPKPTGSPLFAPNGPVFPDPISFTAWSMPLTPKAKRSVTYPQ